MSSLPDSAHPAETNLASSVSLAPLPPPPAFAGAGIGVGGGPADPTPDPALFTRERQAAFLAELAATGIVRSAAAGAGGFASDCVSRAAGLAGLPPRVGCGFAGGAGAGGGGAGAPRV